ncbi:hypothetical protein [Candidatus Ichthyocystis sparus]|uniref:hypothetical protein n=1 Tax=Candidatus Ichthyocystis sparus TaxID=1561004 RepID=UPI000B817FDF|nr:hypothetical protein [Candidatus Ichthyocystis sparus]
MFYTNSKHFNCCSNSDFECQSESKISEEIETTTIIEVHEKNFQPDPHYINKNRNMTLVSSLASKYLIALSMLEGADADDNIAQPCRTTYNKTLYDFCYIASNVCRIINVKDEAKNKISANVSEIIKAAINNSSKKVLGTPQEIEEYDSYFSIPLITPSNITSDCYTIGRIAFYVKNYLYNYVSGLDLGDKPPHSSCVSSSTAFCDYSAAPQVSIFNKCCPSIESYITYPGLSIEKKTTTVSDGEISTTGNNISSLTIVLVVLLSLAPIILAAMGYKACKSRKSHNPQAVPQSDNISNLQEEREDLV